MSYLYKRFRRRILLGFGLVIISLTAPSGAVTQQEIEKIRALSVLTDQHLDTLQKYIVDQIRSITNASDTADVSRLLEEILDISESRANEQKTQRLYSDRFAQTIVENYSQIYNKGDTLSRDSEEDNQQLGYQLKLTAAVLLAKGDNPAAIDSLVALLEDDIAEVRYWGAKGLAGPNIKKFLVAANDEDEKVKTVLDGLRRCLDKETQATVVAQIAAAADLNGKRDAWSLIQQCAARRVDRYRQWSVDNEWVDQDIILRLISAASSQTAQNDENLQRSLVLSAADLYCAAYERYHKGMLYQEADGTPLVLLSFDSQHALQTLLVEGEIAFLRLTNMVTGAGRTGRFLPAFRDSDWRKIDAAYEALTRVLDTPFKIGNPLTLPDPPQDVIEKAKTINDVQKRAIGKDIKPIGTP